MPRATTVTASTIPEAILAILGQCIVEENVIRIPMQLDRPTYVTVNSILEGIGGKWNRKSKGHTFEHGDAETLLQNVLNTRQTIDVRKQLQFFPTPEAVVDVLLSQAELVPGMRVLEPSAGRGNLAEGLRRAGAQVTCVELHDDFRKELASKGFEVHAATDFLHYEGPSFPRIVMNPPFSKQQDVAHVRHAYSMLEPGGILVAVMAPGWQYRVDRTSQAFRDWTADVQAEVEELPEGSFTASGTNVRSLVVKIRKP